MRLLHLDQVEGQTHNEPKDTVKSLKKPESPKVEIGLCEATEIDREWCRVGVSKEWYSMWTKTTSHGSVNN